MTLPKAVTNTLWRFLCKRSELILIQIPLFQCFIICCWYTFLFTGLELDDKKLPPQMSFNDWPEVRRIFTERFASKTQAEWLRIFDGTDACVTPVLSFEEVSSHPHNQERGSFVKDSCGEESPRPAPVLSRTPAEPNLTSEPVIGQHTVRVLEEYGFAPGDISSMLEAGVIECSASKAKL